MYISIERISESLTNNFTSIPSTRKDLLDRIAGYIQTQIESDKPINLNYICTHNSRRSHFGQVWSAVAASYYKIKNVHTFSGGTEATAFNPNAIQALMRAGFRIEKSDAENNPLYRVYYSDEDFVSCFSKVYSDLNNPVSDFAAIMTCTDADEKCPMVSGATIKITTPYEDPKLFDGTALQELKYDERCRQIALECLYVFSQV